MERLKKEARKKITACKALKKKKARKKMKACMASKKIRVCKAC